MESGRSRTDQQFPLKQCPRAQAECVTTKSSMVKDNALLWQRYVSHGDMAARALLVDRYLKTAKIVAAVMYAQRFDDSVDFNDYLQYARIGLIEAVDQFDPAREASFATYASYRVRGAILNGLATATERLAQNNYRRQVLKDRVNSLRVEPGRAESSFTEMVELTIGLALGYVLEDSGSWNEADESDHSDPYRVYELKYLRQRLTMILKALPDREKKIVTLHYIDHMDFNTIAVEMDLSRGRVSQLHARAIQLMRQAYDALGRFGENY